MPTTTAAVICCCLLAAGSVRCASGTRDYRTRIAQHPKGTAKKIKDRLIRWDPPNVDGQLGSVSASPPCAISSVLQQANAAAQEMVSNLPNFTAKERIQYQAFGQVGGLLDEQSGIFEYLALFAPKGTGWAVQETRTPDKGTEAFPASAQDIGLPELALIFLPSYQKDYDMTCQGAAQWNGKTAWVIHFQQRPDEPAETLSFSDTKRLYPVRLKGRAWLAADSGEVVHLETGILEPISVGGMLVRNWWLSINYGPVQFHSQNVRMWLPQTVDAYAELDGHRTIIYHTFADFMVFSVHTRQKIQKLTVPH